ncbi:hypothetical protein [Meiothermus sp.]|uniref:hypothetical protein n=1 Tax=Meiothermus sp. TaxID=1955249 RepID=UPI00307F3D21
MPSRLRKLLIVAQLTMAIAGTFTLAAAIIWLRNNTWSLFAVALLIMGASQLLLAFFIPGFKVFSADSEMSPFWTRVLLIAALLALLAAIGFNYSALLALA